MKTAKTIINQKFKQAGGIMFPEGEKLAIEAMEEYANQFKYDYSKNCKCKNRSGSTWCCNNCGLPLIKKK